jgi:hypothetical protein
MEDDGLGEMLDPSLDLRDEDLMTRGWWRWLLLWGGATRAQTLTHLHDLQSGHWPSIWGELVITDHWSLKLGEREGELHFVIHGTLCIIIIIMGMGERVILISSLITLFAVTIDFNLSCKQRDDLPFSRSWIITVSPFPDPVSGQSHHLLFPFFPFDWIAKYTQKEWCRWFNASAIVWTAVRVIWITRIESQEMLTLASAARVCDKLRKMMIIPHDDRKTDISYLCRLVPGCPKHRFTYFCNLSLSSPLIPECNYVYVLLVITI